MITGATKNKVDDIWQRMWEGGVTNPIEVIMQLTYLMFMKSLDDKELEAENRRLRNALREIEDFAQNEYWKTIPAPICVKFRTIKQYAEKALKGANHGQQEI